MQIQKPKSWLLGTFGYFPVHFLKIIPDYYYYVEFTIK